MATYVSDSTQGIGRDMATYVIESMLKVKDDLYLSSVKPMMRGHLKGPQKVVL